MSQQELLKRVIHALEAAGVDYMLTGSLVSSLQGEPRSTHDIDLVVAVPPPGDAFAQQLAAAFPSPAFHLNQESVKAAVRSRESFNLIDASEGDKVDFWILTDEPFDQCRFDRKYVEEFAGTALQVSRAEDTILMKLKWAEVSGGSEKQFVDTLRVYEVQHKTLDHSHLENWAQSLGVEAILERLKNEAEPV